MLLRRLASHTCKKKKLTVIFTFALAYLTARPLAAPAGLQCVLKKQKKTKTDQLVRPERRANRLLLQTLESETEMNPSRNSIAGRAKKKKSQQYGGREKQRRARHVALRLSAFKVTLAARAPHLVFPSAVTLEAYRVPGWDPLSEAPCCFPASRRPARAVIKRRVCGRAHENTAISSEI